MMPDRNGTAERGGAAGEAVDYRALYTDYWSREDRWGSHSFHDPEPIADQILASCGGGPLLDVGCGMGLLVRTLLRRGVDARGVDIAPAPVAEADRLAPGRFAVGSILELPFEDGAFDTVISTDCLEHVAEADVPRALRELARVTRRSCFVRLAITPDRDGRWHLTVRDRRWWERRFFEAGLRRHPLAMRVVGYDTLADEGWQVTLLFEKAPAPQADPPQGLDPAMPAQRDLTREAGEDAEAAIARVDRAAWFVRQGDVVLDANAGAGWASAMLAAATDAEAVTGLCPDEAAAASAREQFAARGLPVRYRAATPGDLSGVAERSVGLLLALDLCEDAESAVGFAREAQRVLEPGGRLVVGLPGPVGAADVATGAGLLLERCFAQFFGEGRPPRRFVDAERLGADERADWSLLVLAKDPVGATRDGYVERTYPDHQQTPGFNVAAYARDHDNPWLLRSMISIGLRGPNRELTADVARRVLETARRGSADEGAAICVLAYRLLDGETMDPDEAAALLARIEEYHQRADDTPLAWRWRISNQYAAGLILMARGLLDPAREAMLACAAMDPVPFSPLLASKSIDALFHAGLIDAAAGRPERARESWVRGLRELERALKGDWLNIWGSPERPLAFGLPDVGIMLELASRCAFAILSLDQWESRPGPAWRAAHRRTFADHRRRIDVLERSRDWLERERSRFKKLAQDRQHASENLREWIGQIESARDWLAAQRDELREALDRQKRLAETAARAQREARARLEAERDWLRQDRARVAEELARRGERIETLASWSNRLEEARRWMDGRLGEQRSRIAELEEAVRWQREARERSTEWLQEQIRLRDEEIARLRDWAEKQREAVEWHTRQQQARQQDGKEAPGDSSARGPHAGPAADTMGPGEGTPPAGAGGQHPPTGESPPAKGAPHHADRHASRTTTG